MPKRTLTVQNKGTDHKQQQINPTRSSTKRSNTDETVPAKKPKIEEKAINKENVPKQKAHQNNTKSKKSQSVRSPSPVQTIEPVVIDDLDTSDDSDNDIDYISDDDDDDSEEEELQQQMEAAQNRSKNTDDDDDGKDHPTNKQYVIYENMGPNKEQFIISKTARYWNKKYRKDVNNTNPDFFDMYIHNDFNAYGELEVVENCLLDLTKAVFTTQQGVLDRSNFMRKPAEKVNYILGFRRLEVLTLLLTYTNEISGIDDGERFDNIMRVIGACYVTILRGLLPQAMFKKLENIDRNLVKKLATISNQIPNFKQVLERAVTIGHMFVTIGDLCSTYTNILQIVYCNWIFIMENTTINFNTKPKNINDDVWNALKHAASIDSTQLDNDEPETFDFLDELREYKAQYGLGGNKHDLTKWPRGQRALYALEGFNPLISFLL